MSRRPTRRQLLQAGSAALLLGNAAPVHAAEAKLPQRLLGDTKVSVPILGLGTVSVGNYFDAKAAAALLNKAIDLGVTYIDTAPGSVRVARMTGYGKAQAYLAGVLKERRKEVFLATKCFEPEADKVRPLLMANLKELGVEQVDLTYTHTIGHAVYKFDDLVADAGPMAALAQAKKDGLTRLVGVTGHNRPEKFAQVVAKRDFDAMMNAVNIVDRHTYAFEDVVWPAARKKGVGLVAMKVYGGGILAAKMPDDLRHASFRFAQSVPGVALTVIGMNTEKELEQNVVWAKTLKPMTADEAQELKAKTVELAKKWGTHLDQLDGQGEKARPLVNT